MAAVRMPNFSVEEVLAHDIFNDGSRTASERPPDCLSKLKEALTHIAREKSCVINNKRERICWYLHKKCQRCAPWFKYQLNCKLKQFFNEQTQIANQTTQLFSLNHAIKNVSPLKLDGKVIFWSFPVQYWCCIASLAAAALEKNQSGDRGTTKYRVHDHWNLADEHKLKNCSPISRLDFIQGCNSYWCARATGIFRENLAWWFDITCNKSLLYIQVIVC